MESNNKKRRSYSAQHDSHNGDKSKKQEVFFDLGNYNIEKNSYQGEYDYNNVDNPFFTKSSVKLNVKERTNNADDYFENKDYKPWDENDEFNKRTGRVRMDNSPRVRRKNVSKSRMRNLKSGVGKMSRRVFSTGDDENLYTDELNSDGITDSIINTRKNKRLLDELNSKKKPLSKRQRKLKNIALCSGIVLVVLMVGAVLSLTVLFKCEKIEVTGVSRYEESDIIAAGKLSYGENIFMLDKASASKNIEEKYPYIEKADITFGIPNRIIINVTEATPEYYIQNGTKFYITSKDGKVLEEAVDRELDIPTIIGCKLKDVKVGEIAKPENDKILTVLNEIATTMEANGVTGIKEINLTDMSNIELNYQNRITIALGMPEYIDYKMRTAMTIIFTKLSESDKGRLDCSNLIEDRTDGKSNKSYFSQNNVISEKATEQATQNATEAYTEEPTEPAGQSQATQTATEPIYSDAAGSNSDVYIPEDTAYNDTY